MPMLTFSKALTANQLGFNPLIGWQYEYLPWPAHVKVLVNTTAAAGTVLLTLYTGSETIVQRSPVGVGGTAGVLPNELSNPPLVFMGAAGDRLIISIDEGAGATPTVNGIIYVEPAA
jgi:hypothetical protein